MNLERNTGGAINRGRSEAGKQKAIEAIDMASTEYRRAQEEIARLEKTPDSDERDAALIVQYGKRRLAEGRLGAMGVDNPPDAMQ